VSINFKRLLRDYNYNLPADFIALKPVRPRDSAKLLVYQRSSNKISYDKFFNLSGYLPLGSVLVFNQTKVIPARLVLQKESGGKVRVLYLGRVGNYLEVLADRKLTIDSDIFLNDKLKFKVIKHSRAHYLLKPSFAVSQLNKILEQYGKTPLPPYLRYSPLSESSRREQYQTVFARVPGSVAAPTASLHFTKRLLHNLKKSGVSLKFVTLHVNLGTFAPLTQDQVITNKLHREYYEIDKSTAQFLNKAKMEQRPIIAVGTTVVRALESSCVANNKIKKLRGDTRLFIKPGYKFKFVNGLITNFHVPRSSLLMLVSAFLSRQKLFKLYNLARRRNFRFFSFGDGMMIR
jgi:S-adenosylmethionine:tRNA ribosyltransferase-isomerase